MNKYNLIVSYTTRPMRESDINGKTHWFISESEAQELLSNKENILAYTEINEYKYFTTKDQIINKNNVFIIDPNGIKSLNKKGLDIKIISIQADKNIRLQRAINRKDNIDVYNSRVESEKEQFDNFELDYSNYDKLIINNNNFDVAACSLITFMQLNYTPNTLFLIVGRTCSGKDSLTEYAIEKLNNM